MKYFFPRFLQIIFLIIKIEKFCFMCLKQTTAFNNTSLTRKSQHYGDGKFNITFLSDMPT